MHPRYLLPVVAFLLVLLTACTTADVGGPAQPTSAAKLSFTVQPSDATAGTAILPAITIQDAFGNTVPTATNAVTVAIGANPGGGTLSGVTTVNPVNGVASFPGLSVDMAGTGYTLAASSVPLTGATSEAFSVAPGPVASVWVNPGAAILNWVTGPNTVQLRATAVDAHGNTVTVPTAVTWSSSGPAATVDATGLVVGIGGTATITASTSGQTGMATIAAQCGLPRCSGMPSASFSQLPDSAESGAQFVVQVSFPSCGFCSDWSGVVSIALGNNPTGATLTGNTDQSVSRFSGATWSSLRVDKPGIGYTLVAIVQSSSVGGGVFGSTSSSFNITQ